MPCNSHFLATSCKLWLRISYNRDEFRGADDASFHSQMLDINFGLEHDLVTNGGTHLEGCQYRYSATC